METALLIGEEASTNALAEALLREGIRARTASSPAAARALLDEAVPNVVFVDASAAGQDPEAWARLRTHGSLGDVPVVAYGTTIVAQEPEGPLGPWLERLVFPLDEGRVAACARLAAKIGELRRALTNADAVHRGLISMLLHDLRTPLSSLSLNLELVEMAAGLAPEEREDVAQARLGARALIELMATVQSIGRLEAGQADLDPQPNDLAALAEQAIARLRPPTSEHPIDYESEPEVPVRCDPESTLRLIDELVTGAANVTPSEHPVRIRVRRSGSCARIEVGDQGLRIPRELRDLLLTREGTVEVRQHRRSYSRGFGPLYCRLAAEAHGGRSGIDVDDESPGERGNTFWVELPTG